MKQWHVLGMVCIQLLKISDCRVWSFGVALNALTRKTCLGYLCSFSWSLQSCGADVDGVMCSVCMLEPVLPEAVVYSCFWCENANGLQEMGSVLQHVGVVLLVCEVAIPHRIGMVSSLPKRHVERYVQFA